MPGSLLLGVNLSGAEWGSPLPGVYGEDYTYPTHAEIDYYAAKGMNVIRLPFQWERLQHSQFGQFNTAELGRLDDVVSYATGKGLQIAIEPHNFGYWNYTDLIGTAQAPNSAFADLWSKLATHYKSNSGVIFDLMNEPHDQTPTSWLGSVNAAITAIRNTGATQEILVPGTDWDGGWTWVSSGNAAVIGTGVQDPGHNFAFELHQYLDPDGGGEEPGTESPTTGVERLTAVTQWAEQTGSRLFLGEVGVSEDQTSLAALDNMLTYMQQHSVWQAAVYWAGGPWWDDDYIFSIEPLNGVDRPQMGILRQHLWTSDASNDFNGDGKSDVLFAHQGAAFASSYEWQINNRSLLSQGAIDLYDKAYTVLTVGDYDGDGKSDVLFQNPTTGGVYEWRLDGRTILQKGAVDVGDPAFHLLGTGDFNGDGKDDVLFRNNAGFVYQWQMNGLDNTPLPVSALATAWHVQGTGDFNGDGNDDILLRKIGGAANENGSYYLWQMNGATIAAQGGIERPSTNWKTLGIGDFDGDGKDDIALRNVSATSDNGAVYIYLMNGTAIKAQGAAGIANPTTWHLAQIGDFNGDAKDDILFRNDAGTFYSWDMNGTHIGSEGLFQGAAQNADPSFAVVQQHWDLV